MVRKDSMKTVCFRATSQLVNQLYSYIHVVCCDTSPLCCELLFLLHFIWEWFILLHQVGSPKCAVTNHADEENTIYDT